MPREFSRPQRVADFLKRELATLIQQELRDPRLGMVSVNDVEVSRDLSFAKVYVTALGKESQKDARETIDVLNNAAGFLRAQISHVVQMRITPKLRFYFDESVSRGSHLSALIDKAVAADGQHEGGGSGEENP